MVPIDDEQYLRQLVGNLAQAINRTIAESETIQETLEAIKEKGYNVEMSMATCIGLYQKAAEGEAASSPDAPKNQIKFEFDQCDIEFLKALKIKADDL